MKTLRRALLLPLLLAGTAALAAPPQTPATFLQALYAHYTAGQSDFDPTGDAAPSLFTPSLLALINADAKQADGGVGRLDGDPICDCQDASAFKLGSITVTAQTKTTAKAVVKFNVDGTDIVSTYTLDAVADGWRIDDISDSDTPSLRGLLTGKD
jgi:hypothetical protein